MDSKTKKKNYKTKQGNDTKERKKNKKKRRREKKWKKLKRKTINKLKARDMQNDSIVYLFKELKSERSSGRILSKSPSHELVLFVGIAALLFGFCLVF